MEREKESDVKEGNIHLVKQLFDDTDISGLKSVFDSKIRETNIIVPTAKPTQKGAMKISMANGALPLFAQDLKIEGKINNEKEYLASSYTAIHYYMKKKIQQKKERNLYELMLSNVPCDLFVDIDISLERNPNYDFMGIEKDFILYVKRQMIRFGYCNNENDIEVMILDSTDPKKISRHYIFRLRNGKMFKDVTHCGAFMRNLRNNIQEKEGIDPNQNRFFAWTKRTKPEERDNPTKALCFIVDMGIYTIHRVFRLLGCTKYKKESYLNPMDENGNDLGTFDTLEYEEFAKYFVQRNARHIGDHPDHIVCQEPDGSEPRSTSDLLIYRLDMNPVISRKIWKEHYEKNYPFDKIWKWFGHPFREFCFEYPTDSKKGRTGTFWKRHVFFDNENVFKTYVLHDLPVGIHIGPICESNSESDLKARKKELVFDIDLDEYVDSNQKSIRGCCGKERKCCKKCWELAIIAKTILGEVLKKFMGFKKVKFFFSGGRGMHCWVLDSEAKTLSREDRLAILNRFKSIKTIPKSLEMRYILQRFKKTYLLDVMKSLQCDFGKQDNEISKTELLTFFWPKFDAGPTEQISHPVKSPFVLHRTTLKVANQIE